ncbi:MAG: bifunctional riboflavin kinase/FAD synthetase [bacterium]
MQRYPDFTAVCGLGRGTAVTIGNFDGVHRGHQALLHRVDAFAAGGRLSTLVLTFEPHPVRVLAPALAPPLITRLDEKLRLLAAHGVEGVVVQPFDRAFAALTPEAFVRDVLVDALGVKALVVGHDFTYGARRGGTTETLVAAGAQHGFEVEVVSAQAVGSGLVASSSKVREFVLEGRMDGAALVLGRPFSLIGEVVAGAQRGRKLGFPTANLAPESELLPRTGVYAGWLDWEGALRPAVVNVGHNPTFVAASDRPGVEVHVIGATALALYGRRCRLWFAERLREERRFDGVEALVAQIARDRDAAVALLATRPAPEPVPLP